MDDLEKFKREYYSMWYEDTDEHKDFKPTYKQFILVEMIYYPKKGLKVSVIDNGEFMVIASNLYIDECLDLLDKLNKYYRNIILDVGEYSYYFYGSNVEYEIKEYVRQNKRLSVLGAYIELLRLKLNQELIDIKSL